MDDRGTALDAGLLGAAAEGGKWWFLRSDFARSFGGNAGAVEVKWWFFFFQCADGETMGERLHGRACARSSTHVRDFVQGLRWKRIRERRQFEHTNWHGFWFWSIWTRGCARHWLTMALRAMAQHDEGHIGG